MDQMIFIKVKYCSQYFNEILGTTKDGRNVVAFIINGKFKVAYPYHLDEIYVSPEYVYNVEKQDPLILPFMRFGPIAYYILDLLDTYLYDRIHIVCNKAILKVLETIIPRERIFDTEKDTEKDTERYTTIEYMHTNDHVLYKTIVHNNFKTPKNESIQNYNDCINDMIDIYNDYINNVSRDLHIEITYTECIIHGMILPYSEIDLESYGNFLITRDKVYKSIQERKQINIITTDLINVHNLPKNNIHTSFFEVFKLQFQ